MAKTNQKTQFSFVELKKIKPDEAQPRKDFDPAKLASLISSIKKHGIKQPLVVQQLKDGTFLLVDGERRYRASTQLKLKEVPVIIEPVTDDVTRLVQQFHIQEQHQSWTATEKAMAIGQLADQLEMNFSQISELLGISKDTARSYKAFWDLLVRREFEKTEMRVSFAINIRSATERTKRIYETNLEKTFNSDLKKKFQLRVVEEIKKQTVTTPTHLANLVDAFKASPDLINDFLENKTGLTELYHQSGAEAFTQLRTLNFSALKAEERLNQLVKSPEAFKLLKEETNLVATLKRIESKLAKINKLIA